MAFCFDRFNSVGAGISGLVNGFGGKLTKNGLNDILLQHFGKDLKQLTSKELDSLSNTLFDQGMSITMEGIVDKAIKTENDDSENE